MTSLEPAQVSRTQPAAARGLVDLSNIAASVEQRQRPYSSGFYVTTQVFRPGERPNPFRFGLDGGPYVIAGDEVRRHRVAGGGLLLVKVWQFNHHTGRGMNTTELLGDIFIGRPEDPRAEPVEACLPPSGVDPERLRIAVKGRFNPTWTVVVTTLTDERACALATRVALLVLVLAPQEEAA